MYGLTELARSKVRGARLVANPGCYPTSVQLPLVPLVEAKLISTEDIIIDAKSGMHAGGGKGGQFRRGEPGCPRAVLGACHGKLLGGARQQQLHQVMPPHYKFVTIGGVQRPWPALPAPSHLPHRCCAKPGMRPSPQV